MTEKKRFQYNVNKNTIEYGGKFVAYVMNVEGYHIANKMNILLQENEQLKKDVDYWKQVASQYSNELNVFEHRKKYKTECKNIYWSSD